MTGVTHKTFDTFASDWSGCTIVAFDKVINKFKATNAGHKDMLAVLAAVTEVRDKMNPKYIVPTPIAR